MAKDCHSLWLNSAALARADGDLQVPGGVVETDDHGEPTGVLREESAWHFREHVYGRDARRRSGSTPCATGVKLAQLARRHRRPRQGRLARRSSAGGRTLRAEGALTLRVWQSLPHEQLDAIEALGLRSRPRRRPAAGRLHEGLHGRHARLEDRAAAGRLRRRDHEPRRVRGRSCAARRARASRSPCTRSATRRTATRSTASRPTREEWRPRGLRPRIEHAQLLARGGHPALRGARRRRLGAVQPRAVRPRPRRARPGPDMTDRAYAWRSLLDAGALRRERLRRADRGARPAGRDPRRRPAHARRPAGLASRAGRHRRGGAARDHRRARLARRRRAPPRQAPPRLPRRPRRARPRPARDPARGAGRRRRSSRRCSAAAGCTAARRSPSADRLGALR